MSFKKINLKFVEKEYPVLFATLQSIDGLSTEQKEQLSGLCLEIALKSDGTINIFEEDIDEDEFLNEEDY